MRTRIALALLAMLSLSGCSATPVRDDNRWRISPYTVVARKSNLLHVDIDNPPLRDDHHQYYLNAFSKLFQAIESDRDTTAKIHPDYAICTDYEHICGWMIEELSILQDEYANPTDIYWTIVYFEQALQKMYLAPSCRQLSVELKLIKEYSRTFLTQPSEFEAVLDYHAVRLAHINVFLNARIIDHGKESNPIIINLNRALVDCIKTIRLHGTTLNISSRVKIARDIITAINDKDLIDDIPRSLLYLLDQDLGSIKQTIQKASTEQLQAYCASIGQGRFEALSGLPPQQPYTLDVWISSTNKRLNHPLPHKPGEELGL